MAEDHDDHKQKLQRESDPLLPQPSTSGPATDRPRTVRHHRRALSGRSTRSHLSGQISFGPSFNPNIYPDLADPSTRHAKHEADRRARSRFLKSLLLGIALWLVVGFVCGWAGLQRAGWGQTRNRVDYGAKPEVPHGDGRAIWCAKFDGPRPASTGGSRMPGQTLESTARFAIPLAPNDRFFIHGLGSFAKGRVQIAADSASDDVQIYVTALTNDEALVDLMTVCHVDHSPPPSVHQAHTTPRDVGLGIYTPAPEVGPYPDSDLEFKVTVSLPKGVGSIEEFRVRANLFAVTMGDLAGVTMGRVWMETTAGPIRVEGVASEQVSMRTTNGHIEGAFNVSRALNLATTNGAIVANVALTRPAQKLAAASTPSQTPDYRANVDVATINGAASVDYVHHPPDFILFSSVVSTNGRAVVQHGPAYEGDFEVETTWGSATIEGPSKTAEDPTGRGRERQKHVETNRDELGFRHISGTVWWGLDDPESRKEKSSHGFTRVKTTLGSARAVFL